MAKFDTSLGGPSRSFPTTIWSDILAASDRAGPESRDRMGTLLQTYWKPVYGYIRAAWRKPVEEAKDLTQAFFIHLLERDYLSRMRPEKGSFRSYLKQALQYFLIDGRRAEIVRRPVAAAISLDAGPEELERIGFADPGDDPERVYQREWLRTLMEGALVTLRASLEGEGKKLYFEVFEIYHLETGDAAAGRSSAKPSYKEIAAKLSLQETDVGNYLVHARKALDRILRERIREYVADDADVQAELLEVLRR